MNFEDLKIFIPACLIIAVIFLIYYYVGVYHNVDPNLQYMPTVLFLSLIPATLFVFNRVGNKILREEIQ